MNFRVTINGSDVSDIALVEGLEITRRTDEAISTARIVIQQRLDAGSKFTQRSILEQQEIYIREDSAAALARFGGYISELARSAQDNEKYTLDIRAADFGIILERKVSAQFFVDQTDRAIAQSLAAEAGITAPDASVDFTDVLAFFDARDMTVREAFERLCEATGCRWFVDPQKVLHYYLPGMRYQLFNLSDTPDFTLSFPYQMTSFQREFSSAANSMLFLGGVDSATGAELRVTRDDTASIATYGVIEAVKVDRSVTSAAVADLTLKAELGQRAQPRISGRAVFRHDKWRDLELGYTTGVKSSLYGIDDVYQIYGLRYFIDRAAEQADGLVKPNIVCEIEFGQREADFVSMMRRLMRDDPMQPAVIGPDTVIPAENIVGVIGAEHIGGVAAENISGLILAHHIGTVAAETITGVIGGPGSTATVYAQSITGVIGGPGSTATVNATSIVGVIVGAQLTDQILDTLRLVGPQMGVVERIPSSSTLPLLPHSEYPPGSVVMWNSNYGVSRYGIGRYGSNLYEVVGTTWVKTKASAKLTGLIQYDDIVSIHAEQIVGLIIASQIENITAKQITGIIQGDQIDNITADSIISVNGATITGPVSAASITALNAHDIVMVTKWDETRIESVSASSITAGTITALVTMTSPDIRVTGSGYNLVLNNSVGLEITATSATRKATFSNSQILITGVPGDLTRVDETGFQTVHPVGTNVNLSATSTQSTLGVASSTQSLLLVADGSNAYMQLSGSNNYIYMTGSSSWLYCKQHRFDYTLASLTIPASVTRYITVYDSGGNVIGKVPCIP